MTSAPPRIDLKVRLVTLLVSLLGFLLLVPLLERDWAGMNVPHIFAAVIYVFAVRAVAASSKALCMALGLAIASVALGGRESPLLREAGVTLDIGLLTFTSVGILRFVFSGRRVTDETLLAAISLFLLLGLTFARVYFLATLAFGRGVIANDAGDVQTMPELLYFSFTTLTTVGFGDMKPILPFVRSIAIIEAITGQLYLAVLIGRLVGLHIIQSNRGEKPDA